MEISKTWERYSWIKQNVLKSNEWRRIWILKTFKIEMQNGGRINSDFLQNWFCPEIGSYLFNLKKFQKSDKSSSESSRTHWNLMNDKEFGSLKFLKLKYRRGDKIIQTFCRIGFPQKFDSPCLTCTNVKTLRKLLLNHAEFIEI